MNFFFLVSGLIIGFIAMVVIIVTTDPTLERPFRTIGLGLTVGVLLSVMWVAIVHAVAQ